MDDTRADMVKESQAETLSHKQGNVEMEAPINIMAHTVLDIKVKKFLKTLGDVQAMKLFYTLADTVDKAESGKLQHTLANTLAQKLNTWRNTGQCLDLKTLLGLTR